jgi:LacI family transcriptional regulator
MKLTILDLARKAGVSVATISRAANPKTRHLVAPETLRTVDALIQKYRYTASQAAKHLRKAAYETIGVLFPHHEGILNSEYYSNILSGVADALLDSEYKFKMILLKPQQAPWDAYDFKNGEGVDGLIVTYWRSFFKDPSVFKKLDIPCVVINNCERGIRARFVAGDHYLGGQVAARYLCMNGHRRFAVVKGAYESPDIKERLRGFLSELDEAKIRKGDVCVIEADYQEAAGYAVAEKILEIKSAVTAVFCMADTQAFGLIQRFRELNVACPKRISVVGYDNDRRGEHGEPPLTSVHVPVYDLAREAARDLILHLRGEMKPAEFFRPRIIPVQLVERLSVEKA